MFEFLFEILGELVLQIFFEGLAELGFRWMAEPFRRPRNPWIAGFAYALFGAGAGGLSLLIFSAHLVHPYGFRVANLILTPILVGLLMYAVGQWRRRRGDELIGMDRFAYGYLFALAMGLIRFFFAN